MVKADHTGLSPESNYLYGQYLGLKKIQETTVKFGETIDDGAGAVQEYRR